LDEGKELNMDITGAILLSIILLMLAGTCTAVWWEGRKHTRRRRAVEHTVGRHLQGWVAHQLSSGETREMKQTVGPPARLPYDME
jgi:hypothetical protein